MKGKAHIQDKPEMKEFAKKVLEIRTYGQKDSLGLSRDDAVREFALGKAAMYFQGIWSIQPIKEANPKLNFAMFPFPANTAEATKTEVFVDTALGLPKGGKNEKASRKFVEFMASKEAAQIYVDEAGYPSAIKGVENSAKEIKSLSDLISAGKVYLPVSTNWLPGMTDDVGKATQELVAKQSIDDYLVKLDSIFFNKANQ
jgi:raffinose/stachyose/melibiose transport system substrate-binding protein